MADQQIQSAVLALLSDSERSALAPDGMITAAAVDTLRGRYPYFALPAMMLLRSDTKVAQAQLAPIRHALARTAPDAAVLGALMADGADGEPFYPDEAVKKPTTESAIDTFLSTYGSSGDDDEEILNKLIFNPAPDYAQILAQEEKQSIPDAREVSPGSHDDLLNRFIIKQKQHEGSLDDAKAAHIPQATVENRHDEENRNASAPADNSLLSESLAKIFIRQKQYEHAYEIISQLSLNYPEKSVYFADQMRFLRKIINNRRHQQRKQ